MKIKEILTMEYLYNATGWGSRNKQKPSIQINIYTVTKFLQFLQNCNFKKKSAVLYTNHIK